MKFLEYFWRGCGHCSGEEGCAHLQDAARVYDQHPWFRGHRMVGVALLIFIVPLVLGVLGGHLANRWAAGFGWTTPWITALGLVGGIVSGALLARNILLVPRVRRRLERRVEETGSSQ